MSYNGWKNYETWRVNLELFDGLEAEDLVEFDEDNAEDYEEELATALENYAEEFLQESCSNDTVRGWAEAFLAEVDYREIAQMKISDADLKIPVDENLEMA